MCELVSTVTFYVTLILDHPIGCPEIMLPGYDFQRFLDSFVDDILSGALLHCPSSEWICELESNVTFYVNIIPDHPTGCPEITPADYVHTYLSMPGLVIS